MITEKFKIFRSTRITVLSLLLLMFMATTAFALAAPTPQAADSDDNDGIDWFAVAAETIGMDDEFLFDELLDDKSIADLATEKDVAPQTVIEAIIAAETEWVNQQVSDDNLSQDEADEWLEALPEEAKAFVEEKNIIDFDFDIDCEDDDCDWVDWFAVAAKTIGMDDEALFDELLDDKSIADLAIEKDVEPQTVIEAIITAETEWVNQQVSDDNLSQDEADEWLEALPEEAKAFVEEKNIVDFDIDCDDDECDWVDWFVVAAKTIGMDDEALFDELLDDKSIADLATEKDVAPQTVIEAIITAETEWVNQQVADDNVSQDEADEWLELLPEEVKGFVENKGIMEVEVEIEE